MKSLSFGIIINGMNSNFDTLSCPRADIIWGETSAGNSNEFNTRTLREFDNIFCGPVWIGIESVDDGPPGVDFHDPIQHLWMIDLHYETIK